MDNNKKKKNVWMLKMKKIDRNQIICSFWWLWNHRFDHWYIKENRITEKPSINQSLIRFFFFTADILFPSLSTDFKMPTLVAKRFCCQHFPEKNRCSSFGIDIFLKREKKFGGYYCTLKNDWTSFSFLWSFLMKV